MLRGIAINNHGASILESLIAGVLLAVAVCVIFAVVGQGSEITHETMLRRRAYQELERILENPAYSYKSYTSLAPCAEREIGTVVLDNQGSSPLNGTMYIQIDSVSCTSTIGAEARTFPAKIVRARIAYQEDGEARSETLQTAITFVDAN